MHFLPRRRRHSESGSPKLFSVLFKKTSSKQKERRDSSSSSSSDSSSDIRRPSGLGRRASAILFPQNSFAPPSKWPAKSMPDLLAVSSSPRRPALPPRIVAVVASHSPQSTLPSLALVSKTVLPLVQAILYAHIDLATVRRHRRLRLIELLAHHPPLARLVHSFSLPANPPPRFSPTTTPLELTPCPSLSAALVQMSALSSLTLPTFHPALFASSSFSLTHLTLLSPTQHTALLTWLHTQPSLQHLTLPNLTSSPHALHTAPPALPNLRTVHAPPSLALALLGHPGTRLQRLTLTLDTTLYTGLRPAALMGAIAHRAPHEIALRCTSVVDKRTLEKVLGAAGGVLDDLDKMEVHVAWDENDSEEILYKIIDAVLPRFHTLRTLILARSPAPPPRHTPSPARRSRPAIFASSTLRPSTLSPSPRRPRSPSPSPTKKHPAPSPPTPPLATEPAASSLPPSMARTFALPAPRTPPRTTTPSPAPTPTPSARAVSWEDGAEEDRLSAEEHAHVLTWARACPSLGTAVFVSGRVWRRGAAASEG